MVLGAIAGAIATILSIIPFVGFLLGIASTIIGIYCLAGIVIAILDYLGIIQ